MLPTIDQGAQVDDDHEHPAVLVSVPINSDSYANFRTLILTLTVTRYVGVLLRTAVPLFGQTSSH